MPRTSKGRIVYNRRPHLFRYSDVYRIVKQVRPVDTGLAGLRDLGFAESTVLAALADVQAAFQNLIAPLLAGRGTIAEALQFVDFLSKLAEWLLNILSSLPKALANIVVAQLAGFLFRGEVQATVEAIEEGTNASNDQESGLAGPVS